MENLYTVEFIAIHLYFNTAIYRVRLNGVNIVV